MGSKNTGKPGALNKHESPHPGLQSMLVDQAGSEGWVLVTHGGAFTHLHHDAEGLATYVVMNCGAKIWVPISPESTSPPPDLRYLFSNMDHFIMDNDDGKKSGVGGCILLEAGDIL
jgi:hypothetical protein